jgi:hypothetical protein
MLPRKETPCPKCQKIEGLRAAAADGPFENARPGSNSKTRSIPRKNGDPTLTLVDPVLE